MRARFQVQLNEAPRLLPSVRSETPFGEGGQGGGGGGGGGGAFRSEEGQRDNKSSSSTGTRTHRTSSSFALLSKRSSKSTMKRTSNETIIIVNIHQLRCDHLPQNDHHTINDTCVKHVLLFFLDIDFLCLLQSRLPSDISFFSSFSQRPLLLVLVFFFSFFFFLFFHRYVVVDILPSDFSFSDAVDKPCGKTPIVHKAASPSYDVASLSMDTCAADLEELTTRGAVVLTVFQHHTFKEDVPIGHAVVDLSLNEKRRETVVGKEEEEEEGKKKTKEKEKEMWVGRGAREDQTKRDNDDEADRMSTLEELNLTDKITHMKIETGKKEDEDEDEEEEEKKVLKRRDEYILSFREILLCNGVRITGEPATLSPSTISGSLSIYPYGGRASPLSSASFVSPAASSSAPSSAPLEKHMSSSNNISKEELNVMAETAHNQDWDVMSGNQRDILQPPPSATPTSGLERSHVSFKAAAGIVVGTEFMKPARDLSGAASANWEDMSGNVISKKETNFEGKLKMNINVASVGDESGGGSSSSSRISVTSSSSSGSSGGSGGGRASHVGQRNSLKKFQSSGDFNDNDLEEEDSMKTFPVNSIHRATSDLKRRSTSSTGSSGGSGGGGGGGGGGGRDKHTAVKSMGDSVHDNICGWLRKKNSRSMLGISTWRTRWFELNNRTRVLEYYLEEHELGVDTPNVTPHAIIDMTKYIVKDLGDMLWELVPPHDVGRKESGEKIKKEKVNKKNSKTSNSRVWRFKADDMDHKLMWMASMKVCSKDGVAAWGSTGGNAIAQAAVLARFPNK